MALRASDHLLETAKALNPLADLVGTWMGKGWSVTAVPKAGGWGLQYRGAQHVLREIRRAGLIPWPHVTVANLVKQ